MDLWNRVQERFPIANRIFKTQEKRILFCQTEPVEASKITFLISLNLTFPKIPNL